jgi:ankyrin repeat protein
VEAIVRLLLKRGAFADVADDVQQTALAYATEERKSAIIKLLFGRGANPTFALGQNLTPLKIAVSQHSSTDMGMLLAAMTTQRFIFGCLLSLVPSREYRFDVRTAKVLSQQRLAECLSYMSLDLKMLREAHTYCLLG